MEARKVDLIIANGRILTQDPDRPEIEDGALIIDQGRILALGPRESAAAFQAAETLDANGGLIIPGLINSHTHAAMTLFRGLADDLPLMEWLEGHIFPAEAKLNPELIEIGTRLACAEMIASGVTCFVDMYLWADTVARTVEAAGLRAFIGEVLYDFPSPHYGQLDNGFAFTAEMLQTWQDHARISFMVMPHALYTCSPSLLERAWDLAAQNRAEVHIHLAESPGEEFLVNQAYGKRPVEHLNDLGLLTPNTLAAHAVHLNDEEIALLAEKGVRAAHCPESNMKLASGVARLEEMLAAGIKVGLGTDGAASNNDLSLLGEMRSAALIHKAVRMDPTAASAETVLELATSRAAEAAGLAGQSGRLKEGWLADVAVIDTSAPHLMPLYNPVSHLVYAASPSDVRHTVCHGRVLMKDRQLTTIEPEKLAADVKQAAEAIKNNGS